MLIFLNRQKTFQLLRKEVDFLQDILRNADYPMEYVDKATIYWTSQIRNDANGALSIFYPGDIFLNSRWRDDCGLNMKRIAATYAHEGVHFNQFQSNPLRYFFRSVPGLHKLWHEDEAEAWEKMVNVSQPELPEEWYL